MKFFSFLLFGAFFAAFSQALPENPDNTQINTTPDLLNANTPTNKDTSLKSEIIQPSIPQIVQSSLPQKNKRNLSKLKKKISPELITLRTSIISILKKNSKHNLKCQILKNQNCLCKFKDRTRAVRIQKNIRNNFDVTFFQHGLKEDLDVLEISKNTNLQLFELDSQKFFSNTEKNFLMYKIILKEFKKNVGYLYCRGSFFRTVCKYDNYNTGIMIKYLNLEEQYFLINFYRYGKQKRTAQMKIKSLTDVDVLVERSKRFFQDQREVFETHAKIVLKITHSKQTKIKCVGSVVRTTCFYDDNTKAILVQNEVSNYFKVYFYKRGSEALALNTIVSNPTQFQSFSTNLDDFLGKQKTFFILFRNLVNVVKNTANYFLCTGNALQDVCSYNGKDKSVLIQNVNGNYLKVEFFEYGQNKSSFNFKVNTLESLQIFKNNFTTLIKNQENKLGNNFFTLKPIII